MLFLSIIIIPSLKGWRFETCWWSLLRCWTYVVYFLDSYELFCLWSVGYDCWLIWPILFFDYMGYSSLPWTVSCFLYKRIDGVTYLLMFLEWDGLIDLFMGADLCLQICLAYLQNVILSLYEWNKIMPFFFGKKNIHPSYLPCVCVFMCDYRWEKFSTMHFRKCFGCTLSNILEHPPKGFHAFWSLNFEFNQPN